MTEAPTGAADRSGKQVGSPRGVGKTILLSIVTLGIYTIVWQWKTFNEVRNYRGQGLGGFAGFLLSFVAVSFFLLPSYIGKMHEEDGERPAVTGWSGLWILVPYIGTFIWLAKLQGALNDFWVRKGAPRS
jgi:uncharacterized protein DUF4234